LNVITVFIRASVIDFVSTTETLKTEFTKKVCCENLLDIVENGMTDTLRIDDANDVTVLILFDIVEKPITELLKTDEANEILVTISFVIVPKFTVVFLRTEDTNENLLARLSLKIRTESNAFSKSVGVGLD